MNRTFGALHARAFCHATEDPDRVRAALVNVLGDHDIAESRTEGHHGNPIAIFEATVEDPKEIDAFLTRLSGTDIRVLIDTLDTRVDDGCNLFMRIDKQEAFAGRIRLGAGDDVISIRLKVRAFPAKADVARAAIRRHLMDTLAPGDQRG